MIPQVHFIQKWEKDIELQNQPGSSKHYLPAFLLNFRRNPNPGKASQSRPPRIENQVLSVFSDKGQSVIIKKRLDPCSDCG